MRVLIIAPQPFYQDRGTPIVLRRVILALRQCGHTVDMITFPGGMPLDMDGFTITRVGTRTGIRNVPIGFSFRKAVLDLFLLPAIVRAVRRTSYDCMHAVEEAILPTLLVAKLFDLPVLYDMQSSLPEQLEDVRFFRLKPVQAILRQVERWMTRRADAVACSVGLRGHVNRIAPDIPVLEWHYPVGEPSALEWQGDHSPDALEGLGLPEDRFLIAYAGNFASYQGIERLVRAVPMVLARVPNAYFLFVGAEDGEALPGISAGEPFRQNLRVLTRRPQAEMSRILSSADVLVSPRDITFNLPLKVIDYMAVGKPIVATDSPAHRKLLTDESAVLVDCESAALAEGIVRLYEDPALGRAIAAAAQRLAADKLGWGTFTQEIDALYGALAAGTGKAS